MRCVEVEVEFEHPNSRLAEKSKLPRQSMLRDELTHIGIRDVAFLSDARNLEFSRCGRDLGI